MTSVPTLRPRATFALPAMRLMRTMPALPATFALLATFATLASAQTPNPPTHKAVTPELLRTAFADPLARTLLQRARAARLAQDSALHSYDAKSYLRFSVSMGVRAVGPTKLLLRTEQSARVRWAGGSNLSIEPTGRRTAFPLGAASVDLTSATPIPYFPGREALWIPSSKMGVARANVDERELLHPLATGAEAYYRYATGDSMTIGLPDGRRITLRELRVTPREPNWRAFVGSFWFDVQSGSLVRAAYRLSTTIDLWNEANEQQRRKIEVLEARARSDTGTRAAEARGAAESMLNPLNRLGIKLVEGTFTPARANLSAVTVLYGLYDGRFWLPTTNIAEGQIDIGFMRLPLTWQERFEYESVNSGETTVPSPALLGLLPSDTTWFANAQISIGGGADTARHPVAAPNTPEGRAQQAALEDSLAKRYVIRADSLDAQADRARAAGDTAKAHRLAASAFQYRTGAQQLMRRRAGCASDSSYIAGAEIRYGGAVRAIVRLPCDITRLSTSPDLPGSIYDDDALFGATDRDALLASLDFGLQPAWAPQWPALHTGPAFVRYNRIEALSVGASATSALGLGYTAEATARIGTGDHVPNAELSLTRSNGRDDIRVAAYHRLSVANDSWGAPLSVGASIANLLYAHDEGFYYRSLGAEITGSRDAPGVLAGARLNWRAFAERQRSAGVAPNTQASLGNLFGDSRFVENIDAIRLSTFGGTADVARSYGVNPAATQLYTRAQVEAAFTSRDAAALADGAVEPRSNAGHGRLMLDATLSGNSGPLASAITVAGGASAGQVPLQREFFVGGLQTVRGQLALPGGAGRSGDSFWLGRAEVGPRWLALRPTVFYDVGWAGPRGEFMRAGRPLSGAGIGLTFLGGLLRFDAARGIWPERRWRFDLSLGPRL